MKRILLACLLILGVAQLAGAATTEWKWTLYIIMPKTTVTPALKNQFANIYVNNGSWETYANEYKCADTVSKFSPTGSTPATHYGIATPAKTSMKDAFLAFFAGASGVSYVGVASTTLPNYTDHEVVQAVMTGVAPGQTMTWDSVVQHLQTQFGLKLIPEVTP